MNRETLISIINKNGIRFLPVRRCSLYDEYMGINSLGCAMGV